MLPPIILDIEASGFGKDSYPIEIGFIDENLHTWCTLIKPEADWQHWDKSAEHMHAITRESLLNHGKTSEIVAETLNEKLRDKIVYTDGWMHDFTWISLLFDSAHLAPRFKLEDLRHVLTSKQQDCWHTVKNNILADLKTHRHRASIDAKVLQLTWLRTREA